MLKRIQAHSAFILTTFLLLFLGGLTLIPGLPVEPVPDISPQQVMVSVTAPGLAAAEVERLITFPLEASLTGLPEVTDLRSVSRSGVSVVYLQFSDSSDIHLDRERVSQRLQAARDMIPVPGVTLKMGPLATGMGEIMQMQIAGAGYDLVQLNRIMNWTVVPQLKLIPGVVDVNVNGGAEETFQLTLNPARMMAHGVALRDIIQAVDSNNISSGGGFVSAQDEQRVIVGRARIHSLAELGAIPVRMARDGRAIRIRDLGQVEMGTRTRLGAVTRDGRGEIVNGVVLMQNGASSNATLAAIKTALPAIKKSLPPGVTLDIFYTRHKLTRETTGTVKENLIYGAILVFAVLYLVLGDLRATFVIISVIPAALIFALTGMRVTGVSANLLSLGAIDFGMIVDSALVVVEHIIVARHQVRDRQAFHDLAHDILRRVIKPVCFAILIIILVYLPVLTLQGVEGKMFRPMAQTVIMALLASLLYCVFCIPALAAIFLRYGIEDRETRLVRRLRAAYEPALAWCAARTRWVLVATISVFCVSILLAARLGGEFVPKLDEGALLVNTLRLPSAALNTVLRGVTEEERILRNFPEVETVISNTGTSAIPTDPMGTGETDTFIFLKPRATWRTARTEAGLVAKMNAALQDHLPDAAYSWTQPIQMRMDDLLAGTRTELAISIYGNDLTRLSRLAAETVQALRDVPGAADVSSVSEGTMPFIHVDINRDAAARLGISANDITETVEAIGGRIGTAIIADDAIIPTQIRFAAGTVTSPEDIARLMIRRADGGGWVKMGEVAHIQQTEGPSRIDRDGFRRRVIVQANIRGRDVAGFVAAARQEVARRVVLPPGYHMAWHGAFENLQSAVHRLAIVLPIALILMLGLLISALSSLRPALLVFCNLPIAASGGILALTLRGMPFSIAAGIGFIALFGVAVLNGVVLMTQMRIFQKGGMGVAQSAFEAARARFRPVIATAAVASFGFLPMAFSESAGAEVDKPLASVVIGGLISSTILTLFVLPVACARWGGGLSRRGDA
ncbi:CusA/CzcA family heavy metal efflux RND transporter [Candidatus Kirkpatrickella diaphorinae]|uniref:CusA/CzcA family heavy metal efflux RND transporter n=1 Tax=Candidatus Kirkpatrickella diaphorinae TaxID=2984322 RepID=A0ABY6GM90_9PROT|nr:CusA/CzcA family heavy metal efflux RND transporter [Candidatus Kirkpatrickella diaphorinae]UYH51973.1 CusA/CzcA family heavy metal efflux RND transporter [Candidatus Kirkpatrickella diaphorinae]